MQDAGAAMGPGEPGPDGVDDRNRDQAAAATGPLRRPSRRRRGGISLTVLFTLVALALGFGRQAQPGGEPGTMLLPVSSPTHLVSRSHLSLTHFPHSR